MHFSIILQVNIVCSLYSFFVQTVLHPELVCIAVSSLFTWLLCYAGIEFHRQRRTVAWCITLCQLLCDPSHWNRHCAVCWGKQGQVHDNWQEFTANLTSRLSVSHIAMYFYKCTWYYMSLVTGIITLMEIQKVRYSSFKSVTCDAKCVQFGMDWRQCSSDILVSAPSLVCQC